MFGRGKNYIVDTNNINPELEQIVGVEALAAADLKQQGVNIPPAFVLTSEAFDDFITAANLIDPISLLLKELSLSSSDADLQKVSGQIKSLIEKANFPSLLINPLLQAYRNMSGFSDKYVAIKPSWVLDLDIEPEELVLKSKLNVKGEASVLFAIKQVWASLFSPEALKLRMDTQYQGGLAIAVLIQKMVQAEMSGVVYSTNPLTSDPKEVVVEAILGLSVPGVVIEPDIYTITQPELTIIEKIISPQDYMILKKGRAKAGEDPNMRVTISPEWRKKQKLDDRHIIELSKVALSLAENYQRHLEVHWAFETGNLHVISVNELILDTEERFAIEPLPDTKISELYEVPNEEADLEDPIEESKVAEAIAEVTRMDWDLENKNPEDKPKGELEHVSTEEIDQVIAEMQGTPVVQIASSAPSQTTITPEAFKKLELMSSIYLDISNMQSDRLANASTFSGGYFDGTEMLIRWKVLPETILEDNHQYNELIENYAQEIASAASSVAPKPLYYRFSDVSSETAKSHFDYQQTSLDGSERFLMQPEALLAEVRALKKAKYAYNSHNLILVLPKLRSIQEMHDLKKVLSSENIRRSATLKLHIEVAIPSILMSMGDSNVSDFDGVMINFPELAKRMVDRDELISRDYQNIFSAIEFMYENNSKLSFNTSIYVGKEDVELVKASAKMGINNFIFSEIPSRQILQTIKSSEKNELAAPTKRKRGRKPKSLTKS